MPSPTTASVATLPELQGPALDESWACLESLDCTREEDARSEPTDLSSLGETTDNEEDSDEEDGLHYDSDIQDATVMVNGHDTQAPTVQYHNSKDTTNSDGVDSMEDTIVLEKVAHDNSSTEFDYFCKRQVFDKDSLALSKGRPAHETIYMALNNDDDDIADSAVEIAYFGTASAQQFKGEVMGKIGAALLNRAKTDLTSGNLSYFHIAPTEYGAGAKPAFTQFIPSHPPVKVQDVTLLQRTDGTIISIALKDGTVISSRRSLRQQNLVSDKWRPQLLVCHVAAEDLTEGMADVKGILELAVRHDLPLLVVSNGSVWDELSPFRGTPLRKTLDIGTGQQFEGPIDLDFFTNRLDASQLRKHIAHLIRTCATAQEQKRMASTTDTWSKYVEQRMAIWGMSERSLPCYYTLEEDSVALPDETKLLKAPGHSKVSAQEAWNYVTRPNVVQMAQSAMNLICRTVIGVLFLTLLFKSTVTMVQTDSARSSHSSRVAEVSASVAAALPSGWSVAGFSHTTKLGDDQLESDPSALAEMWEKVFGSVEVQGVRSNLPSVTPATMSDSGKWSASKASVTSAPSEPPTKRTYFKDATMTEKVKDFVESVKLMAQHRSQERQTRVKERKERLHAHVQAVRDTIRGAFEGGNDLLMHRTMAMWQFAVDAFKRSQDVLARARDQTDQQMQTLREEQAKILGRAQKQASGMTKRKRNIFQSLFTRG